MLLMAVKDGLLAMLLTANLTVLEQKLPIVQDVMIDLYLKRLNKSSVVVLDIWLLLLLPLILLSLNS